MADTKISLLNTLASPSAGDWIPVVDTANAETKKVDWSKVSSGTVTSVNGDSGPTVILDKTSIGLDNVFNIAQEGLNVLTVGVGQMYSTINAAATAKRAAGYIETAIATVTADMVKVGSHHRLWRLTTGDLSAYIGRIVAIEWPLAFPAIAHVVGAQEILMKYDRKHSNSTSVSLDVFFPKYFTIKCVSGHSEVVSAGNGTDAINCSDFNFTSLVGEPGTVKIMSNNVNNNYNLMRVTGSEIIIKDIDFGYTLDSLPSGATQGGGIIVEDGGYDDYHTQKTFDGLSIRAGMQDTLFFTTSSGIEVKNCYLEGEYDVMRQYNGRSYHIHNNTLTSLQRNNHGGLIRCFSLGGNGVPDFEKADINIHNNIVRGYDEFQANTIAGTLKTTGMSLFSIQEKMPIKAIVRIHDNYFEHDCTNDNIALEEVTSAILVEAVGNTYPPESISVYNNTFNIKVNEVHPTIIDNIDKQGGASNIAVFDNSANGTADFIALGYKVSNLIAVSGYTGDTANNNLGIITAVSVNSITCTTFTGANWGSAETGTGSETITHIISNSKTKLMTSDSPLYSIMQWGNQVMPGTLSILNDNVIKPSLLGHRQEGHTIQSNDTSMPERAVLDLSGSVQVIDSTTASKLVIGNTWYSELDNISGNDVYPLGFTDPDPDLVAGSTVPVVAYQTIIPFKLPKIAPLENLGIYTTSTGGSHVSFHIIDADSSEVLKVMPEEKITFAIQDGIFSPVEGNNLNGWLPPTDRLLVSFIAFNPDTDKNILSVDLGTDTVTVDSALGLATEDPVIFKSDSTVTLAPLEHFKQYYAIVVDSTHLKFAATVADATAGIPIDLTGTVAASDRVSGIGTLTPAPLWRPKRESIGIAGTWNIDGGRVANHIDFTGTSPYLLSPLSNFLKTNALYAGCPVLKFTYT